MHDDVFVFRIVDINAVTAREAVGLKSVFRAEMSWGWKVILLSCVRVHSRVLYRQAVINNLLLYHDGAKHACW